ncbi:MAG: 5'/3'-nucleotidase SurE [Thermoleophilia bacterium]
MTTHILVTNDDGVDSPGLLALKRALEPYGEVAVIAPDSNRSAIGRGITIHDPLHVEEVTLADGSPALATDGTPVDCVRLAALGLAGPPPDMVVSGINMGFNLGDDVTYSGTVAAALEGLLLGLPAIAVSCQSSDPQAGQWYGDAYDFRASAAFAARLVPIVRRERFPRDVVLNVNAPGLAPDAIAGARVTRLGRRLYSDALVLRSRDGARRSYTIYGEPLAHPDEDGTDIAAVAAGEISVTPLHFDLTDMDGMGVLERLSLNELLDVDPAVRRT